MKKLSTIAAVAALACLGAHAQNQWTVEGELLQVDTLYHNMVAPGISQTSLWLHNDDGRTLRAFYCTVDLTNPYITLAAVCGNDHLAGNETTTSMAQRHSQPGRRYVAGVNGDFFMTSGTTSRGVSQIGTPVGSAVVEGTIFRARNGASSFKNFIVDVNDQVYANPFDFGGTLTVPGGGQAQLGGINVNGINNRIVIYNDRYYGSTNQAAGSNEVLAVLPQGVRFETARPFKMVVAAEPSTSGDTTIPDSAYVLRGQGTASTLLGALQVGDTIEVSPTWTCNGVSVEPREIVSGNPKILGDGEVLDTEAERGDANSRQPRAAIGYSDGGDKIYFMVVDGRTPNSQGVRTSALAQIMTYAGVTDAINVDGGGSATLYTSALGQRNHPSDGVERPDGNAFFAVSTAPDDSVVASIRFVDHALKSTRFGMCQPRFYGYNQYGMLVDTDLQGVTLSCEPELGTITGGGTTFFADGTAAQGLLTAHYGNVSASMVMQVVGDASSLSLSMDSLITDTYRYTPVPMQATVGLETQVVNPAALDWVSTNEDVVTVGQNGILHGVANGEALLIGTRDSFCDTLRVIVERPTAHVMPIDPGLDVATWKISQTGGKNGVATANGDGFDYTYTGASGRAPKITLTKTLRLWSLPDTLRLRINPGEAPVKNLVLSLRTPAMGSSYVTIEPDTIVANSEFTVDLPVVQIADTANLANYPITLQSIQINMNSSTTGQQYTMHFNGFETVYAAVEPEPALRGDVDGDGVVDAADVTALVGVLLGTGTSDASDVNGDGAVDATDVTALIGIILGN